MNIWQIGNQKRYKYSTKKCDSCNNFDCVKNPNFQNNLSNKKQNAQNNLIQEEIQHVKDSSMQSNKANSSNINAEFIDPYIHNKNSSFRDKNTDDSLSPSKKQNNQAESCCENKQDIQDTLSYKKKYQSKDSSINIKMPNLQDKNNQDSTSLSKNKYPQSVSHYSKKKTVQDSALPYGKKYDSKNYTIHNKKPNSREDLWYDRNLKYIPDFYDYQNKKDVVSNNLLLKCNTLGGVIIPSGTTAGTSYNIASLNANTSHLCNSRVKFEFACNINTTEAILTLNFQIFQQCNNQLVPIPVSPAWTFFRNVVNTETNTFTFSACNCDSIKDDCCNFSVYVKVAGLQTVGTASISNAILTAFIVDNPCQ